MHIINAMVPTVEPISELSRLLKSAGKEAIE
jgi:hypothetical protein